MKIFARLLHRHPNHPIFHIAALSGFLLGLFIACTAGEMGPFAPLLIAIGLYVMMFSVSMQTLYWSLVLLRRATSHWVQS